MKNEIQISKMAKSQDLLGIANTLIGADTIVESICVKAQSSLLLPILLTDEDLISNFYWKPMCGRDGPPGPISISGVGYFSNLHAPSDIQGYFNWPVYSVTTNLRMNFKNQILITINFLQS